MNEYVQAGDHTMHRRKLAIAFIAMLLIGSGVTAYASHSTSTPTFTGCLTTSTGAIAKVKAGTSPLSSCTTGQVLIHLSGGDITSVLPATGGGLTGGRSSGAVRLSLDYAKLDSRYLNTGEIAAMVWKGSWNVSTTYQPGNVVYYQGSSYIATATVTSPPHAGDPAIPNAGWGIVALGTAVESSPAPTLVENGSCLDPIELEFLALINTYRQNHGLAPLKNSAKLNVASYNHSLDMGTRNYFAHDTPQPYPTGQEGPKFSDRMKAAGYTSYTTAAENIAAGRGTAAGVFEQWKTSAGHNANMLDPDYTQIGIGLAAVEGSRYTYYWTTDFANGSDGAPTCS